MYAAIKEQVLNLTKDEKNDLVAYLKISLGEKSKRTSTAHLFDRNEIDVYDCICSTTNFHIFSVQFLAQGFGVPEYRQAVESITRFVDMSVPETTSALYKKEVMKIVLDCLARYLRTGGIANTPDNLLKHVELIPHSVDEAFPGYAGSKLMHILVGKRVNW